MTRRDGQVYRFTDHDTPLTFLKEPYEPAGGVNPSALRSQAGLHAQNYEVDGPITSDKFTNDDLRKGIWQDTEVVEYIIDWLYPSAGYIRKGRYWLTELQWDGEVWEASVEGGARWLRTKRGGLHTRNCRHKLGEGFNTGLNCTVNISAFAAFGLTVQSVASRIQFDTSTAIPVLARERWRFGRVLWTGGSNAGLVSEVKDFGQLGTYTIELFESTAFDIQVADSFDLEPGCDKIRSTCIGQYSNIDEFGGFPFMPGTNRLLVKPRGVNASPYPTDQSKL